jgi:hypothetical protein
MDRGIPSEAVLEDMRSSDRKIFYLVGTPRSKVRQYEKQWLDLPCQKVRKAVEVKLFAEAGERDVLAKSEGRPAKERTMRRKSWPGYCAGSSHAMQWPATGPAAVTYRRRAERSRQRFSFPPAATSTRGAKT